MQKEKLRILFMGTPRMSATILEHLILSKFNVVGVITNVDKPVGRDKKIVDTPVKEVAKKYNIPVYQPVKIRLDYEFVKDIKPDIILTFAYGQIIPKEVLDMPKINSLNLHASILPFYRGAAPIERAIMNGEKESGVSLMKMVEQMDAGEVYYIKRFDILESDNYLDVVSKIIESSKYIIDNVLMKVVNQEIKGEEQDESKVTFANKIKPEDEKIDLSSTKEEVFNKVRALSPNIGAYLYLGNKKLKIFECSIYDDVDNKPYHFLTINNKLLLLSLKNGHLLIKSLQLEGKKIMDARSFINGYKSLLEEDLH